MSEWEFIYRVAFNEPPLENDYIWEFYFTSLSAIYEKFTPEPVSYTHLKSPKTAFFNRVDGLSWLG